jgi:CopG family transcriptional regulator, nickel-responsive regulator
MSDLVRFGVAMDRALLNDFDERIAAKGYENRSEALRDLVRADLDKRAPEPGGIVLGTLTVLCSPEPKDAALAVRRLCASSVLLGAVGLPLEGGRSIEVFVISGEAGALAALAGRVATARGVTASELVIAGATDR